MKKQLKNLKQPNQPKQIKPFFEQDIKYRSKLVFNQKGHHLAVLGHAYFKPNIKPPVEQDKKPQFKLVFDQKGNQLVLCGYAYFDPATFDQKNVTKQVEKYIMSQPKWYLKVSILSKEVFKRLFKQMKRADLKFIEYSEYIDDQIEDLNQIDLQRLIIQISHISFPFLQQLIISFIPTCNIEFISWMDCPNLKSLKISSQSMFYSLKPLGQTNFKYLRQLKISNRFNKLAEKRSYNLNSLSRMRMITKDRYDKEKQSRFNFNINVLRADFTDVYILAKIQLDNLRCIEIDESAPRIYGRPKFQMKRCLRYLVQKFGSSVEWKRYHSTQINYYNIEGN